MAVMARETWTDERLDDLNAKVDAGFGEMRTEFRAVRAELKEEIGGVRAEIGGLRSEIAAMQRSFNQLIVGLLGTMLVGFLGVVAAILAQT